MILLYVDHWQFTLLFLLKDDSSYEADKYAASAANAPKLTMVNRDSRDSHGLAILLNRSDRKAWDRGRLDNEGKEEEENLIKNKLF